MIKAVRVDLHPFILNHTLLSKTLLDYRAKYGLTQEGLAAKIGVGLRTMNNWERGWTKPAREALPKLKFLLSAGAAK